MSDRIAKFLLMLGSDQPGEVVNAAAMLVKALRKQGRDLHTLVGQLNGAPAKPLFDDTARLRGELLAANRQIQSLYLKIHELNKRIEELSKPKPPPEPPKPDHAEELDDFRKWAEAMNKQWGKQQAYGEPQMAGEDWLEQAKWALAYGWERSLLSNKEYDFLTDMASKARFYNPSYKQVSWIDDIYQRLRRVRASRR